MDALDLTRRPPRSTRATLGGIPVPMLARTVDKLRADQPGGNLGAYAIDGFSTRTLYVLGIDLEDLRDVVKRAKSDDEVADWIRAHTTEAKFRAVTEYFDSQTLAERLDRPGYLDKYPIARTLPPETKALDLLDADDAATFRATS